MNLKTFKSEPIRLSAQGIWYHGDTEITHARTLEFFFKSIVCKRGKYFLQGEKNNDVPIQVDDAPYFVRGLERRGDNYELVLSDGTQETLDLTTLDTGPENQLYCRVKKKALRAIFDRKVYYDFTKDLVTKDGYYGFKSQGLFYPVQKAELPERSEPGKRKMIAVVKKKIIQKKKVTKKQPKKKAAKKLPKKIVKKKLAPRLRGERKKSKRK